MNWSITRKRLISALADKRSGFFSADDYDNMPEVSELIECIENKKESSTGPFKCFWERLKALLGNKRGECELPDHLIKEFARCLLPDILAYFESEEGKSAFEEWKKEKQSN